MRITKIGHCCLLIEEQGARLLTDPGNFSTGQNDLEHIDAVLITHEHGDHLHLDSLRQILQHNPKAQVIVNQAVAQLLEPEGIAFTLLHDGEQIRIKGVTVEATEGEHALIHPSLPRVRNTAFLINDHLFYPGDAFLRPNKPVEVLALPTAGPWLKLSEAIDFAKSIKPATVFPVHDALLSDIGRTVTTTMLHRLFDPDGITILTPTLNEPFDV